ncbi:hypothetical protein EDC01DRAFT_627165 [Geopyxis carbonaria]|nr:hypothetical protein EDC01DRAFT_627165 [Geopyxis carbonaria]
MRIKVRWGPRPHTTTSTTTGNTTAAPDNTPAPTAAPPANAPASPGTITAAPLVAPSAAPSAAPCATCTTLCAANRNRSVTTADIIIAEKAYHAWVGRRRVRAVARLAAYRRRRDAMRRARLEVRERILRGEVEVIQIDD